MKRLLFLTYRMQSGFGVDVVVANVIRHLQPRGLEVTVACLEADASYPDIPLVTVPADVAAVRRLAQQLQPDAIVAHTSPFFEMLPFLQSSWPCWAWEHGDPTPAFFDDAAERQQVKDHKLSACYPHIAGVIAISQFVRDDIGWPTAHVIYNGCDHVPVAPTKGLQDTALHPAAPLRIGTLMRLGKGEARYKGNALFAQLRQAAAAANIPAQFCVMGRGTPTDARAFRRAGMEVHLNAPNAAKWDYLRGLDVFVSCSLWEGCNLPLIEAAALGTAALALDTGAHPEVTPLVTPRLDGMLALLQRYAANRPLLLEHSRLCYHYVRQRFGWAQAAGQVTEILLQGAAAFQRRAISRQAR